MSDLHQRLLAAVAGYDCADPRCVGRAAEHRCTRAALAAALRAVVELHAPRVLRQEGGGVVCPHCYDDPTWPCRTIQAIADQLGLTDGGAT